MYNKIPNYDYNFTEISKQLNINLQFLFISQIIFYIQAFGMDGKALKTLSIECLKKNNLNYDLIEKYDFEE
jgi:hypothetical protein